ncbi:MAG TPA: hypothetical protein P5017_00145, partial [Anaerohalosphaeraceae bacterium]|nr:hypothetical protein [Anaerohalosphaeraceae bacterium]HRU14116.1 hypothetical protein [Anaerohalosphaeraceae bacterium]
ILVFMGLFSISKFFSFFEVMETTIPSYDPFGSTFRFFRRDMGFPQIDHPSQPFVRARSYLQRSDLFFSW